MWRKATLRKCFESSPSRVCLDVCVQDVSFEKREEGASVMDGPGNTSDQIVTGVVNFKDEREATEIVRDFCLMYPGSFEISEDSTDRRTYARYIPQYQDFLMQAFVGYFSKRQ